MIVLLYQQANMESCQTWCLMGLLRRKECIGTIDYVSRQLRSIYWKQEKVEVGAKRS